MRNLKALGLALVAMFAMSAMAASAAYAEDEGRVVTAVDTEEHVTGLISATDVGEANGLELTAFGGGVKCEENNFSGELAGGTGTALTVAAEFGGNPQDCEAAGLPSTVHNNGCELTFNTFTTTPDGTWEATTDLKCPVGVVGIQVTTFFSSNHAASNRACTTTVPPQTGIERVVVHNNANTPAEAHDLTLTAEATNIKAHRSGFCTFGATQSTEEGQMHGEVTVTAENLNEEPIDLYVEHHE